MIKLKREESGLVFELKPPFNDKFFADLQSTINDFMKIGKKSFSYDFGTAEELTDVEAKSFEDLIPLLKKGNCSLQLVGVDDSILSKLPLHQAFAKESKKESQSSSQFLIETNVNDNEKLAILNLGGEFMEPYSLEEFKAKSFEIMERCDFIILDCSELSHISTLAVGGFVFLKSHCDSIGKKVTLCNVAPSIYSTLEMSGILHIIPVAEDLESAKIAMQ